MTRYGTDRLGDCNYPDRLSIERGQTWFFCRSVLAGGCGAWIAPCQLELSKSSPVDHRMGALSGSSRGNRIYRNCDCSNGDCRTCGPVDSLVCSLHWAGMG